MQKHYINRITILYSTGTRESQSNFRHPKHLKGNRAAPPEQLLDQPPELFRLQLVFKLHPPWMMEDSDFGRPSSEHLSRLGAPAGRGSGCLSLWASEGKRGQGRRRRAPGHPAAQTKLHRQSGVLPVRPRTRRTSGTPTRATALWGPDNRPYSPRPGDTDEHSPWPGGGTSRGARVPARRCLQELVAPAGSRPARASPSPARPSDRGKQRSRCRSARRARPRRPHCVPLPGRRTRLALTPRRVRAPAIPGP